MNDRMQNTLEISLDSAPPCTLHFSDHERLAWVIEACERGQQHVLAQVQELFGGSDVEHVDVFGPAVALDPAQFPHEHRGNVSGRVGVKLRLGAGREHCSAQVYSTLGGSPALQQTNPDSAWIILNQALTQAKNSLA